MENCLSVGFARADITPDPVTGYPLGGYGATHRRLSQNLLERLSAHVLLVGEGETPKVFLITCDTTNGYAALVLKLRADLSRATGFPEEMFLIGGTHSHSTPDLSSPLPIIKEYLELISARVTEALKQALSDLRPAKVFYNSVEVGHPGSRLNFCRHYVIAPNGSYNHESAGNTLYCGDNFNDNLAWDYEHYHYVRHAQEVDPML